MSNPLLVLNYYYYSEIGDIFLLWLKHVLYIIDLVLTSVKQELVTDNSNHSAA